ncbi:MAG: hypothetical protein IKI84_11680, partial [Clostridia bacterium]|nr:hypothetical protein [Clostridia bacterium]
MRFRPLLSIADDGNHIIRNTFNASLIAFIVSSLTSSVGSLIDGVIIGQFLGVDATAAFGLVSPALILFALFGAVIAAGARNRFTMLIGKGDLKGAGGVFTVSVILGVGLAVMMMIPMFLFPDAVCVALGASGSAGHLLDETRGYLLGIAVGFPAMNASRVLTAYMTVDNDRRLPVISSVVLTVTDIGLDLWAAMTGGGTFFMGLATSVSHYAALAVLLWHFRRKDRLTRFSL